MNNNTIFALDDEPVILELYKNILGSSKRKRLDFFSDLEEKKDEDSFDLKTFETGEEFLEELEKFYKAGNKLPLCLLDMRLPGKHGLDVAKETRKIDADIAIIIITAYSDYSVKELISQLDHNIYYLHKPFRDDELYLLIVSSLKNWNDKFNNIDIKKELAIDATQDGLWDWDIENNEIYFSEQWKAMLGYEDEELENKFEEWSVRVHPEDLNKAMQDINAHLEKKSDYYVNEHRLKCKDGTYKWILDRGKALYNEEGKAYRITGFHTDISKRKQLEEELLGVSEKLSTELELKISKEMMLKHTNTELEHKLKDEIKIRREKESMLLQHTRHAAMGEMISMIAHQWRQPLTSIGLCADSILLDVMLETIDIKNLKENAEFISKQVVYLSQTIDDFRNFSQSEKNKETILIQESIDNAISIVHKSLENHSVKVEKNYQNKTPYPIFRNEFTQVFLNTLVNALDAFTTKGINKPLIKIETSENEKEIKVTVSDNGNGIPQEVLPKIFEPYFTTKNEHNGTGLGLYMSKTIVEEHMRGTLLAKNIKDSGACFEIILYKKYLENNV
nr:PAS domain-containing protein [uncultured Sulfurimonas sp.]